MTHFIEWMFKVGYGGMSSEKSTLKSHCLLSTLSFIEELGKLLKSNIYLAYNNCNVDLFTIMFIFVLDDQNQTVHRASCCELAKTNTVIQNI